MDEHAQIDEAVCAALGRSRDEIMDMGLREFYEAVADAGYIVTVSSMTRSAAEGRLVVTVDDAALTSHTDTPKSQT